MIEINNLTKSEIPIKEVKEVAEKFLEKFKIQDKDLSIAFVGDLRMKELNKEYRQKDKTTDILSFEGEGSDFGELVINYKQIKRQSKDFSKNETKELIFILVHGLFHLLGYTDDTEKGREEMLELGEKFVEQLKIKNILPFVRGDVR